MKPDLRIVVDNGSYCITEVHYEKAGTPIKMLDAECGILAYWTSLKKLKKSFEEVKKAFDKPVLIRIDE